MKWYWLLVVIFIALGISTLVPAPASKPNLIGYYSHCSFTPIGTIICWAVAGVCYWLGKRKSKNACRAEKPKYSFSGV